MIRVSSKKQAASSYNTASVASQNAARTARITDDAHDTITASRAAYYSQKYTEIAERAKQQADKANHALQQAIQKILTKEIIPPALTTYGANSMINDELDPNNNDIIAQNIRNFSFHVISAKKRK